MNSEHTNPTTAQLSRPELPDTPLVSTGWLAERLGSPGLRIVDVRGEVGGQPPHKRADYLSAHIPGAVFADWTSDFVDAEDPVPIQLARPGACQLAAEALGIGDDDVVVTYDDYCNIFAGRLWWALRASGHRAVRVLDGGWRTWVAEGRPTTAEPTTPSAATFTARRDNGLHRTLDEVTAAVARGVALLDARPQHLYDGDPAAPRSGHIPGAVSVPYPEVVDAETGRFRSTAELRAVFAAAGIDPDDRARELVSSCGSGVSASVACIALDLLGRPDIPVYDGSFAEWAADPHRPVEQRRTVRAG